MDQEKGEDFSLGILKISRMLGEAWPSLATQLGFDDAECESFIVENEGHCRQARYMLKAWIERDDGVIQISTLIEALKEIRRPNLVKELGVEILDNQTIKKVARRVQKSWPKLAYRHLGFNIEDCQNIKTSFPGQRKQAGQMLANWRQKFNGAYPLETLSKALQAMDPKLAKELGPLQRFPSCTTCGNSDPVKFRRYFSQDGQSRLLGICCIGCGQEWLQNRFLLHPDTDGTRPRVRLCGVVLKKQLQVTVEKNPEFQVKSSREEIKVEYALSVLKVGDHITWQRPLVIWHHAIVSGVNQENGLIKVIHWTRSERVMQIKENSINLGDQMGQLYRLVYKKKENKADSAELVIARAKSRLWDTGYKLLGDNCETFASYCKIGVMKSCQVAWFLNKVITTVTTTLSKAFAEVLVAESVETYVEGTNAVGAGIVIIIEGLVCVWNLTKCYQKRKQGDLSKREFVKIAVQRVMESLCGAGLAIIGGLGGQAMGAAVGTFIIPGLGTAIGGFIGSIVGGVFGSLVGTGIGSFIGAPIGRCLARQIGTDDKAVRIENLLPGDQIVSYGNLLHPRHHAIVVSRTQGQSKVTVVHSTYTKGVVEEEVDFIEPVYKVIYQEQNCFLPEEVIKRARSKIVDDAYTYSLVWNNCKHFAQWCKLRENQ